MYDLRVLWTGCSDTPIQARALVFPDCRRTRRQLAVSTSTSLPPRSFVIINLPYPTITVVSRQRLDIEAEAMTKVEERIKKDGCERIRRVT